MALLRTIGTHNGKFHADEVLACVLLQLTSNWSADRVSITRTRDPSVLETIDLLVDVGGQYDPAKDRYDHHQPSFTDTFSAEHRTLLSSAGLIYKYTEPYGS